MADVPKTISIEFAGYYREPNIGGLPASAGVYCVYACTFDAQAQTVDLKRLIYIGESENIKERVANHNLWAAWRRQLTTGQVICVSAGGVSPEQTRHRAEAAMIFKHKPPVNEEYKHSFPFDTTTMSLSGRTNLLTPSFTVKKDATD
ncbi:MAG: GIY-YIG nuclease family protein [Isosphaeraceae bacterium]